MLHSLNDEEDNYNNQMANNTNTNEYTNGCSI